MTGLSRRMIWLAAAAAALLMAVNLWMAPNQSLQASPTTFGVTSDGYKAAYLLLSELSFPVSRSYVPPGSLSRNTTLWLVSPLFLDPKNTAGDHTAKELTEWVRAGATAVVFGGPKSEWKRLGIKRTTASSADPATVISGEWARLPRSIKVPGLVYFGNADDHARVRLSAGKAPFAIELPLGSGKLIAIADDRFIRNSNLAESDDSVLLTDLAHALGPVTFDERCHGLAEPVSIFAAIAYSRAMLPLAMGFILVALWAAEQRSWPQRTLPGPAEGISPSIVAFVESLGTLYSRTRDPAAAFNAYRSGFLHRLRREMSPRAEVPEQLLMARIERDRSISDDTRRWLAGDTLPKNESELVGAVRAIESYPRVGS
jgi:hypothetical protein